MLYLNQLILIIFYLTLSIANVEESVVYLQQGEEVKYDSTLTGEHFKIYCYTGRPKFLIHLWQSVSLEIDLNSDNFVYYEGPTPTQVQEEYKNHHSSWNINFFSLKQKYFKLDPFNQSCIGIESNQVYKVILNVIRIDYWKMLCLISGVVLFLMAGRLSKNVLFYYLCGIFLGICASFLILIYFVSKLFPQKPLMYGVTICGWAISAYIIQLLLENVRTIVMSYQRFVAWYTVTTGTISFVVCYRWGPVTNQRTQNLIRWSLQLLGLILIYSSSQYQEAAVGQIIALLIFHNFPSTWVINSKAYLKRKFPPKMKLLSNAEYYQQGVEETSKALTELKEYCGSPNCNQWKTVLKLKDVKRFASFIEGNSHLSDEEILEYETSIQSTDLTDDDSYTDDENSQD